MRCTTIISVSSQFNFELKFYDEYLYKNLGVRMPTSVVSLYGYDGLAHTCDEVNKYKFKISQV